MFKQELASTQTEESYCVEEKYASETVAHYYDQRRFRNSRGNRLTKLEHAAVARALRFVSAQGSVLDVPCGTGRFNALLTSMGFEVHGSDYSDAMMAKIPKEASYRSLTRGDARELPFPAQTFTGAVCIRLMHHLPREQQVAVLRELNRVTKDFVVVSFHNSVSFKSSVRRLKALWTKQDRTPRNRSTPQEFAKEAAEAGLTLVANFPAAAFFSERWVAVLRKPLA